MAYSTQQMRDAWAPPCKGEFVTRYITPTCKVTINRKCWEAFQALGYVLQAHQYHVKQADSGGYNCRKITGGKGHSLHAYGIAVDINASRNPYGPKLITDMPSGMILNVKKIRTRAGVPVFRWGGDFSGNKDAMHFEVNCTPEEMAHGVDWATVVMPRMDYKKPESWPLLQIGDCGGPVTALQHHLSSHGFTVKVDSYFGSKTEAEVKRFQAHYKLRVDGWVGAATWAELFKEPLPVAEVAKQIMPPLEPDVEHEDDELIPTPPLKPAGTVTMKFKPKEPEPELPEIEPDLEPVDVPAPKMRMRDRPLTLGQSNAIPVMNRGKDIEIVEKVLVQAKKLYKSKTFWVNFLTLVPVLLDWVVGIPQVQQAYPAIATLLPIINIYLRKITTRPVVITGDEEYVQVKAS